MRFLEFLKRRFKATYRFFKPFLLYMAFIHVCALALGIYFGVQAGWPEGTTTSILSFWASKGALRLTVVASAVFAIFCWMAKGFWILGGE